MNRYVTRTTRPLALPSPFVPPALLLSRPLELRRSQRVGVALYIRFFLPLFVFFFLFFSFFEATGLLFRVSMFATLAFVRGSDDCVMGFYLVRGLLWGDSVCVLYRGTGALGGRDRCVCRNARAGGC